MAFDDKGYFHVAIRTKCLVCKFAPDLKSYKAWKANPLPDEPEYLLYVPG